jgi:hypothetical protein
MSFIALRMLTPDRAKYVRLDSFTIRIDGTTLVGATRRLARPRLLASNHTMSSGDNS